MQELHEEQRVAIEAAFKQHLETHGLRRDSDPLNRHQNLPRHRAAFYAGVLQTLDTLGYRVSPAWAAKVLSGG